jgi:hypothetical protein
LLPLVIVIRLLACFRNMARRIPTQARINDCSARSTPEALPHRKLSANVDEPNLHGPLASAACHERKVAHRAPRGDSPFGVAQANTVHCELREEDSRV